MLSYIFNYILPRLLVGLLTLTVSLFIGVRIDNFIRNKKREIKKLKIKLIRLGYGTIFILFILLVAYTLGDSLFILFMKG